MALHEDTSRSVPTGAEGAAPGGLGQALKPRHVTMISIAGVIGAGLFVGSSSAIATAGPAVLVAYAFAGTLVVLVMRMLGEMATAQPDSGSFSTYADRSLGRWAGFTVGWLYWWFWVLVIPTEATAGAVILANWVPAVPQWAWALLIVVLLTATNLTSVANYGEFEFWFALIKVVAIIAFIALGVLAITGVLPGSDVSGVGQLTAGGFMPYGFGAVLSAMLITMFSFMGTEIVTIAAAESKDPENGIRKATNSVIWRIGIFYLASIFIVVALVPYDASGLAGGSYQFVLTGMNIPGASQIMDVVVLIAVSSCLNSALYTASRMAYSLADRGDGPRTWRTVTSRSVPAWAILSSMVVGFVAVIGNYVLPGKIFGYLLATTGAVALFVYLVIACSQLVMRRRLDRAGEQPAVRMWLYPWLTYLAIAFIAFVLVVMIVRPGHRLELVLSVALAAVLAGIGLFRHRYSTRAASPRSTAADRTP